MRPLVIIPARIGSKGVRRKNFRPLPDGTTLLGRAIQIGRQIGHLVVTTDHPTEPRPSSRVTVRRVGPPLHTDTCAMIDVVRDVLAAVPGPPHQPVVLVQPTAPLRRLSDGRRCLAVLARGGDSVCTVTALPARDQGAILTDRGRHVFPTATTRQSLGPRLHVRNGQWYAATRACLLQWGFYGPQWQPIETPVGLNIDTLADWRQLCRQVQCCSGGATGAAGAIVGRGPRGSMFRVLVPKLGRPCRELQRIAPASGVHVAAQHGKFRGRPGSRNLGT